MWRKYNTILYGFYVNYIAKNTTPIIQSIDKDLGFYPEFKINGKSTDFVLIYKGHIILPFEITL